jgi:hypothetical protein
MILVFDGSHCSRDLCHSHFVKPRICEYTIRYSIIPVQGAGLQGPFLDGNLTLVLAVQDD